jgi:hypothetical protein
VQFWTTTDKKLVKDGKVATPFLQGVRVFYKDSQGFESSTGVAGRDVGTLCEIKIPENDEVGAVDLRSGTWIDFVEMRNRKGMRLGSCGNIKGGALSTVRIAPSGQRFNGFFGRGGAQIDRLGVQIAEVKPYLT